VKGENDGRQAQAPYGGVQGAGGLGHAQGRPHRHELAAQHSVHPTLIHTWKKQLLAGAETVFANGVRVEGVADAEAQKAELFEQIGRLKMELEWLKKKVAPFG